MDNGSGQVAYLCPNGHEFQMEYIYQPEFCIVCGSPNLRKPEVERAHAEHIPFALRNA